MTDPASPQAAFRQSLQCYTQLHYAQGGQAPASCAAIVRQVAADGVVSREEALRIADLQTASILVDLQGALQGVLQGKAVANTSPTLPQAASELPAIVEDSYVSAQEAPRTPEALHQLRARAMAFTLRHRYDLFYAPQRHQDEPVAEYLAWLRGAGTERGATVAGQQLSNRALKHRFETLINHHPKIKRCEVMLEGGTGKPFAIIMRDPQGSVARVDLATVVAMLAQRYEGQ